LFAPEQVIAYSSLFSEKNLLWKNLKDEFASRQSKQKFPGIPLICAENSLFSAAAGAALYSLEKKYPVNSN